MPGVRLCGFLHDPAEPDRLCLFRAVGTDRRRENKDSFSGFVIQKKILTVLFQEKASEVQHETGFLRGLRRPEHQFILEMDTGDCASQVHAGQNVVIHGRSTDLIQFFLVLSFLRPRRAVSCAFQMPAQFCIFCTAQ